MSYNSTAEEFMKSYEWVINHIQLFHAGECDLSLDTLSSLASKHLVAVESCVSVVASDPEWTEIFRDATSRLYYWIGRWRAAAAEAAALGFGGDISCKYWQQNIELDEAITMAGKWFAAAKRLVKADPSKLSGALIKEGRENFAAVTTRRSSWPRYRRLSLERRVHKWTVLLARWAYALLLVDLRGKASDAAELRALISRVADRRLKALREAQDALTRLEKEQADFRAIMHKKRTCSHCGRTGPLSQVSFAYCGGCRDSGVARVDWSRYCSEACQRAHWLAGHKDECPCAH